LNYVEATSDELLGAYTRAKDDAMTLAFRSRGKKRLNRVFDVIGFVYLDYSYPSWKQEKKRKTATSGISTMAKGKKIKVLMHRPRYIETARVLKLAEGTPFTVEPDGLLLPARRKNRLKCQRFLQPSRPKRRSKLPKPKEKRPKSQS
jgi:hypothetical protein